jgi:DNA-directed RNA polymerase subunit beta'
LKENVIVGRLIPAGTGQAFHEERRAARMQPNMPIIPEDVIEDEATVEAMMEAAAETAGASDSGEAQESGVE